MRGYTVNVPFAAGVGDAGYRLAFDEILVPILRQYRAPDDPGLGRLRLRTGRDPLGGMNVTETGFLEMARRLHTVAAEVADGRTRRRARGRLRPRPP